VNDVTLAAEAPATREPRTLDRVFRDRILESLRGLRDCVVTVREGTHAMELGTAAMQLGQTLRAGIRVRDPEFYRRTALNGSVGAAEAYMDGMWECDDLVALVRILVRNVGRRVWARPCCGPGIRCVGIRARAVAATSRRTTIWATISSSCSSMRI
jgi:hypothetical protein